MNTEIKAYNTNQQASDKAICEVLANTIEQCVERSRKQNLPRIRSIFREITRWLKKVREIQWDYKNIVKRKGKLERLK